MQQGLCLHPWPLSAATVPKKLTCTGGRRGHSLSRAWGRWDRWKGAHWWPQWEHAWRKRRQEALGDCKEKGGEKRAELSRSHSQEGGLATGISVLCSQDL